ncbi:MAG TPA: hypothetical protein VMW42_10770 [Desulfatiglandales bacterium]|nr:hypothetical protein [Desulfatiglandales bacterium]
MRKTIVSLNHWPRSNNGNYIFQSTEEAIFFAHLAVDKPDVIASLTRGRALVLADIKASRGGDTHNLQRLMDLSVKSQFFRECLEEIKRINNGGII